MSESTTIIQSKSETTKETQYERLTHGMTYMEILYVTEFVCVCLVVVGVMICVATRYFDRCTFDQMNGDSENDALLANNSHNATNNDTTPNGNGPQDQHSHTPLLLLLDETSQEPSGVLAAELEPSLDFQQNAIVSNQDPDYEHVWNFNGA